MVIRPEPEDIQNGMLMADLGDVVFVKNIILTTPEALTNGPVKTSIDNLQAFVGQPHIRYVPDIGSLDVVLNTSSLSEETIQQLKEQHGTNVKEII